jgi:hypothetical protein
MSNPSSPKVTQQQIDAAMQNEQSLVKWLGTGGLEAVLSAMNQNIVYRGIMAFADTTSMALAGGADSQYAVCVNGVIGLNFYKYYPNIDASVFGAITSNEGGQWRPIFASQNTLSGVWKEGAANEDIIPAVGYENSAVAIGKTTAAVGLWLDFASLDSLGVGRGVRLPVLTTTQINAKTLVANEMFYNSTDKMLLRYDGVGETKSVGVLSGSVSTPLATSATGFTVTFGATQHVTSYKVFITATNNETATLFKNIGFFITAKTDTTFRIGLLTANPSDITLNFDYQISH